MFEFLKISISVTRDFLFSFAFLLYSLPSISVQITFFFQFIPFLIFLNELQYICHIPFPIVLLTGHSASHFQCYIKFIHNISKFKDKHFITFSCFSFFTLDIIKSNFEIFYSRLLYFHRF